MKITLYFKTHSDYDLEKSEWGREMGFAKTNVFYGKMVSFQPREDRENPKTWQKELVGLSGLFFIIMDPDGSSRMFFVQALEEDGKLLPGRKLHTTPGVFNRDGEHASIKTMNSIYEIEIDPEKTNEVQKVDEKEMPPIARFAYLIFLLYHPLFYEGFNIYGS